LILLNCAGPHAPGEERTTSADLHESNVLPDVEQAIPENQQEEPITASGREKII